MSTMEQWTVAVCADLGLDPGADADLRAVLDLTRDVAHGVARPAAPLTAYLVGLAVGRGLALPDAAARVSALAAGWGEAEPAGPMQAIEPNDPGSRRTIPAHAVVTVTGLLRFPGIARRRWPGLL